MKAGASFRSLARAAATLLWVYLVCFVLLQLLPGDPLDRLDSPGVPAEQAARNREAFGLEDPIPTQLVKTLASYARGDLGVSFTRRRAVKDVIAGALPFTFVLGLASLSLAYGAGIPSALGIVALPRGSRRLLDRLLLVLATVPRFWLGVMLVLLLHGVAGWLPASHAFSPGSSGWLDGLRHLVLPSLTLALPASAVICRYQLAAMEDALDDLHVRAARAAGMGGARLIANHVLRPSLGPAIALLGLDLPVLVSGAIVVEVVFAWPGLGLLTADAVLNSDYPLALASVMLTASLVIAGRAVAEILSRRFDPRQADRERERTR